MLLLFPMRCGLAVSEGAQQAAVMQCAVEAGMAKGQISGSLGNFKPPAIEEVRRDNAGS